MNTKLILYTLLLAVQNSTYAAQKEAPPTDCQRAQKPCECFKERSDYYENRLKENHTSSQYNYLEFRRKYFKKKALGCQ